MGSSYVFFRELMSSGPTQALSPSDQFPGSFGPDVPNTAASFKPSIAVIIGVLTTMFSLTFLLLLYAKHCKRSPNIGPEEAFPTPPILFNTSDSGIDRSVVEALPMFTFGSLQGMKDGLECAVCLSRFEENDILRLLPKCKHAFHLECVDTWLFSHSTCPLCRHHITVEDTMEEEETTLGRRSRSATPEEPISETAIGAARISSFVGRPSLSPSDSTGNFERSASGQFQFTQSGEGDSPRRFETIVRKDGLLLAGEGAAGTAAGGVPEVGSRGFLRKSFESSPGRSSFKAGSKNFLRRPSPSPETSRRLGHRIVIADVVLQHRWSDFVPSDVLFLRSQTIFGPEEKARVSVSRNELPIGASPMRHSNVGSPLRWDPSTGSPVRWDSNVGFSPLRRDSYVGSSSPFTLRNALKADNSGGSRTQSQTPIRTPTLAPDVPLPKDLELGLEADTPSLSAGKPSKSIKLDCESKTLGLLMRASSLSRPEESAGRKPLPFQRSLSEITGMDRMAHIRMSSRDLLLAGGSSEGLQTQDQQEKSQKWSSIARRTLNWVMRGSRDKRPTTSYNVDKMLQFK